MRSGLLILAVLLVGACTATPITLPFNDGIVAGPPDGGVSYADGAIPDSTNSMKKDLGWSLDQAAGLDDAAADGGCLECPLSDGMADASAGDAEAGPVADALPDLVGDLAKGD